MKMASLMKTLNGSVEIYLDKTLGIGSYGQVCKAKFGRLPCAAKILHPTLFQFGMDSDGYIRKFQQECEFLSTLKHPNIVQHLGTTKDPSTGRPVLLIELLDESLTCYLKESEGSVPYHTQVNISMDVALALSYLHSNGIIHRDLSSNNVLLLGKGGRAKVTDFGLYKLIDTNPCVSPLAHTQGTLAYMPPEVLIIPPNYSSQMDCFSLGVLIVQIITRNFPDPGDAHKVSEDASHPTGSVVVQIPELERRKRDIDVIESDHPLLPVAICCLHDRSMDRPPASELCEKLAKLKTQEKYASSVESYGDQTRVIQKMKEELEAKEKTISETKAELQKRDKEHEEEKKVLNEQLTKTKQALEKCQLSFQQSKDAERKEFQAEMQVRAEKHEIEKEKMKKEIEAMKQQIEEQHSQSKRNEAVARKYLMEMEAKDEEADNTSLPSQLTTKPTQMLEIDKTSLQQDNPLTETGETNSMSLQQPLVTNNTPLQDVKQGETDDVPPQQVNKPMETSEAVDTDCAALQQDNKTPDSDGAAQQGETDNISQQSDQLVETTENMSPQQDDKPVETPQTDGSTSLTEEPESVETPRTDLSAATKEPASSAPTSSKSRRPLLRSSPSTLHLTPSTLTWRQGHSSPDTICSLYGSAVVHNDTAYYSCYFNLYAYDLPEDKWSKLRSSQYQSFSLAILDNQLTTIGGISREQKRTKSLFSLVGSRSGMKWKELYPPMPTHRVGAAALTTPTHLIVAGGRNRAELKTIEVMNRQTFQWTTANSLPEPMAHPQIVLSNGSLYVCKHQAFYSCSLERFLQSCHQPSDEAISNGNGSMWKVLVDTPNHSDHTLCGYGDQVLAVGGHGSNDEQETAVIHAYDRASATWSAIGEMPTARLDTCVTVFDNGQLVVVGGWANSRTDKHTEIGSC